MEKKNRKKSQFRTRFFNSTLKKTLIRDFTSNKNGMLLTFSPFPSLPPPFLSLPLPSSPFPCLPLPSPPFPSPSSPISLPYLASIPFCLLSPSPPIPPLIERPLPPLILPSPSLHPPFTLPSPSSHPPPVTLASSLLIQSIPGTRKHSRIIHRFISVTLSASPAWGIDGYWGNVSS